MKQNVLFVLAGNCRTFVDCIDSCYSHIISKLFMGVDVNIHIYLYLKLTDPGPKGTPGLNFTYQNINHDSVVNKINEVKDRSKYFDNYARDATLLRGLHCHYNFERCGKYILEKEVSLGIKFDSIIYIRPDLYFTEDCKPINTYDMSKVTLATGCYPGGYANDHIAIIPRDYCKAFFFDRMEVYRTNTTKMFDTPETVYWHTINYNVRDIGKYYTKRSADSN
jgi:hypothetical protein